MSFRHKAAAASQTRPRYPTTDHSRRNASSSHDPSREFEKAQRQKPSPGYILEWNTLTSRRRNLSDVKELRAELLQLQERHVGLERLLVVEGGILTDDEGVLEALRSAGGVDGGFLDSHRERRGYRGVRRGRAAGWWWCWEYPEGVGPSRFAVKGKDAVRKHFSRVSLWRGSDMSILLLPDTEHSRDDTPGRVTPPRLRHQDAMTNASTLRQNSHYGTVDVHPVVQQQQQQQQHAEIEAAIWESLGESVPLEEVLGELVYERWMGLLERMAVTRGVDRLFGEVNRALEVNLDCSRVLEKQGRPLSSISSKDWEDILSRTHRRLLLSTTQPSLPSSSSSSPRDQTAELERNDEEQRSLDRISYLGGILLPVTVVSGVLAIEGDYGPEGGNFWVFWVASAVAAVVTILVIHVDRVRSLQVWMEVAADAVMEGGEWEDLVFFPGRQMSAVAMGKGGRVDGDVDGEGEEEGEMKAWRRKKLGWGGAVKKVSGYYRLRGAPVQFQAPHRRER